MIPWAEGNGLGVVLGLVWVRTGLAAGAGLMAGALLRGRSPGARSLIYRVTFGSVLAATLLPAAAPHWMPRSLRLAVPRTTTARPLPAAWGVAVATPLPDAAVPQAETGALRTTKAEATAQNRAAPPPQARRAADVLARSQSMPVPAETGRPPIASLLAGVWAAGGLLLLLQALGGALRIRRVIASSRPAADDLCEAVGEAATRMGVRPPRVRTAPVPVPFVVGVLRPVIVLPEVLCRSGYAQLRPVLLHELAHVRRRDCAFGWLSLVMRIALWPQPLIWCLDRAVDETSEEACDTVVVEAGWPKKQYATCLLELAVASGRTGQPVPLNAAVGRRSSLSRRVEAIMRTHPAPSLRPVTLAAALVGVTSAAIALAACAGTRAPSAGGDPQPILAVLSQDPRLAGATISLATRDRPLGEVVAFLSKRLGLSLTATRDTSDDRVTLLIDHRPAAETLARIAALFGFRWKAVKEGYQLVDPAEHRRSEELLRENELRWQLAEIQSEMARRPRFAGASRQRLEALRHQDQAFHEQVDDAGSEAEQDRRRGDLEREMAEIDEVLDPRRATCLAIAGALRPGQLRELLDGGEVRLSETDGSLPFGEAQAIHACFAYQERYYSGEIRAGWGGGPDRNGMALQTSLMLHEFDKQMRSSFGGPSRVPELRPATAVVRLEDPADEHPSPGERRGGLRLSVRLTGGERPIDWEFEGATWQTEIEPQPAYDETDPLLRRPVEIRPPAPDPAVAHIDDYYGNANWPERWLSLSELLQQIHEQTGLDVISDSFARTRVDPSAVSGKMRLGALLDRLAARWEYRWERDGDLIVLRNARAYRDRVEAAPERVLAPWRARVQGAGVAELDSLSELCAHLTDAQLRGLSRDWGWYVRGVPASWSPFYANRRHLRFWGSLTPWQRRACRQQFDERIDLVHAAPILPFATMSPVQKRAFAYASAAAGSRMLLGFRLDDGYPIPGASYSFHYYFQSSTEPVVSTEMQLIRSQLPN